MNKPFQRKGSKSNSHVGAEFETAAQHFFTSQGIHLKNNVAVPIGINGTKSHKFDLGDLTNKVLVECKSHTWTEGSNVPSAKMTSWNQAMYFFHAAPPGFRRILFVLKHHSQKRRETLADYYIRTNHHLIPIGVEIWEYNETLKTAERRK